MPEYTTASSPPPADLNRALRQHDGLVHWVVRRQWLGDLPYAEALQAGRIGLWQALTRYDPARGATISTYAVPAITHAVWRAVKQTHAQRPEHLTRHVPLPPPDLERALTRQPLVALVRALVAELPQPLQRVIRARYGLADAPPQTFAAIGAQLGLTRQRAHQLHTEALLWLAHPAHSLAVRQQLERTTVADYQAYLARQRAWQRRQRRRA